MLIGVSAMYFAGLAQQSDRAIEAATNFFAYAQFVAVHAVINFLLLHRMWRAIQDGQTTITVGKAIGYLFIPLFNIYWIFRAWGSFPTEFNRYIDRYGLPVEPLAGKAFVAYPILLLAGILYVPLLALPIVFIAVISNASDAVDHLDEAVRERRNELSANRTPNQFCNENLKVI